MSELSTDPMNDPAHKAWMDRVERHADWIARATAEFARLDGDAAETERALDRYMQEGREDLGAEANLSSLISAVPLPPTPSGLAADARLRRLKAQSEAAYGAVLRAHAWQADILNLCSGADGMLLQRLHNRTLTLMESPDWEGSPMQAAACVVVAVIEANGLEADADREIPRMEDVQRKAFATLKRDIDNWRQVARGAH